jgi:aminopeptidase YwaD
MTPTDLVGKAEAHLRRLCVDITARHTGSAGNRAATDLFATTVAAYGFAVETPPFDCIDWVESGADLAVEDVAFQVKVSPFTLGCEARAPLVVVSTVAEMEAADIAGKIVLLRGEIAQGQLMPKNFPFYNPDEHKHIIHLLETRGPQAIVAATARDPDMVGSGVYPFPLIEDGDFAVPSVYMTDEEGERLAACAGREATLTIRAQRIPATGCNVVARKGGDQGRVVLFAHIDARLGTPGASDNASGTVVMLLLAELLADYAGQVGIEIVAMNGEDYFSNPGEQQWLAHNAGRFDDILLGINVDDVGYRKGRAAYSLYDCPAEIDGAIRAAFAGYPGLVEGPSWYQGDHSILLLNQVPAVALTAEELAELMAEITHTPRDNVDIVDPARLVEVAQALYNLLQRLANPAWLGQAHSGGPPGYCAKTGQSEQ